ncbi:MAG TPA: hypothetical protein VF331_28310 [Polyangiales bacterium]
MEDARRPPWDARNPPAPITETHPNFKPVTTPAAVDACLADGSALPRVRRREAALYVVLSKNE